MSSWTCGWKVGRFVTLHERPEVLVSFFGVQFDLLDLFLYALHLCSWMLEDDSSTLLLRAVCMGQ